MQAELRFHVMGSDAHLIVVGANAVQQISWARQRLEQLESLWSRFNPASEISQLNSSKGRPMLVSEETFRLVTTAVTAWEYTDGLYDPTLIDALIHHGYDRTFSCIGQPKPASGSIPLGSVKDITWIPGVMSITLASGVGFDPGGIGKGLAADMVVEELLARGALGAMANVGGDIRVGGTAPEGMDSWSIGVDNPFDPNKEILRIAITTGAVVTSSKLKRQWTDSTGKTIHHLLDARTGKPIDNEIAAVTVVAGQAWWAEALTKAIFTRGLSNGFGSLRNASAIVVDTSGNRHLSPDLLAVAQ